MGGFLGGMLGPGINALSTVVGGAQGAFANAEKEKAAAVRQQIAAQRQAKEDQLNDILKSAQSRHLDAQSAGLENPTAKPVYDSARGAIVDTTGGTAKPVAGLPDKPAAGREASTIPGTPEWKAAKLWEFKNQPKQEPLVVTANPSDPGGPGVFTPRNQAAGKSEPSKAPGGTRGVATIRKAVAANQEQLSVLDDALKELDAYPDAVGLKRGLGDFAPFAGNFGDAVNQRQDPKGVDARASIANIGSMILHDRSGAAITVSEFPRLAPFIPRISDNPETIKKKLIKLKAAIAVENDALQGGAHAPASSGNVDLAKSLPPLSAEDKAHAARDPGFAAWLTSQGYE